MRPRRRLLVLTFLVTAAGGLSTGAAHADDDQDKPDAPSTTPPPLPPPPPTDQSVLFPTRAPELFNLESKPIVWREEWGRFGVADWIVTGAGGAVAVAAAIIPPQPKHLYGGFLFDDDVRDTIRLANPQARFNARDVSDAILSLEATWPFFVDAVVTAWWIRRSPDVAAQMAMIDAQALAIVTAIQGATNTVVSRERPYGRLCGTPDHPTQTVECEGNVRHRSFFSGHAAFSFMSASLICAHHMKLGLLGKGGDIASCVVAYAGATATATLRVMADMHYTTDILVGTLVGTAVGLSVPLFRYWRSPPKSQETEKKPEVGVSLIPVGAGLGVGGVF